MDLSKVINEYPSCLNSRSTFSALIKDLYPSEKVLTNIVLGIYDSGIYSIISSATKIERPQFYSFLHQLTEEYGFREEIAADGIRLWAAAYNVPLINCATSRVGDNETFTSNKRFLDLDYDYFEADFDYVVTDEGVIIRKYIGPSTDNIMIPNVINGVSIVGIYAEAFSCNSRLKMVALPKGLHYIGDRAFFACTSLASVQLPNNLERVGANAFEGCTGLNEVIFPDTIKSIGPSAFANCTSLQRVVWPYEMQLLGERAFFRSGVRNVIMPIVGQVGKEAFAECKKLEIVDIENLISLSEKMFYFCPELKAISLPQNLEIIEASAFDNSAVPFFLKIPNTVREIKSRAFACTAVKNIFLPNSVQAIGKEAIGTLTNITTVYCYKDSFAYRYARDNGFGIGLLRA